MVRLFTVGGSCGIPVTAKSVSGNVTVVNPSQPGDLQIYPGDISAPVTSSINFRRNRTRANNVVFGLSSDGRSTAAIKNDAAGPVDVVLDVNGYFR